MASTNPARGMRDFLPADVRKREYVIGIIKQVYESYGFEPIETPAVENIETLMGKYGEEGNQLIFKILKRGEKLAESLESAVLSLEQEGPDSGSGLKTSDSRLSDLALRYDLTVPLARVVANNRNDLPKFFKRYQIQPVWRADRPARGRFREFYQCDVDCIGSESMVVEAEIISAAIKIFDRLKFRDFGLKPGIRINDRTLLDGLLQAAKIEEKDIPATVIALDKIDKIGTDGFLEELKRSNVRLDGIQRFLDFINVLYMERQGYLDRADFNGAIQYVISRTNEFLGTNEIGRNGLKKIAKILNLVEIAQVPVVVDPMLARGLSYYTGAIMEAYVPDLAGSLGGGGRYDGLIGMFGKEQIPACGFSLGLERILVVMEERGMFPPEIADSRAADVLVTIFSDETVADSLKLANQLRTDGLRVTLYPQADKEDKQWKYANLIGVPFICTVRGEDLAEGMVSFQNLRTRERFREKVDQVAAKIKIA